MKISIGCDELGLNYKDMIVETFSKKGHEFQDAGVYEGEKTYYPIVARKGGQGDDGGRLRAVHPDLRNGGWHGAYGQQDQRRICRSLPRHLLCTERSVLSNNCNTMCMGALVIGPKTAEELVGIWLGLSFDPNSRSYPKVQEIYAIESKE